MTGAGIWRDWSISGSISIIATCSFGKNWHRMHSTAHLLDVPPAVELAAPRRTVALESLNGSDRARRESADHLRRLAARLEQPEQQPNEDEARHDLLRDLAH